MPLVPVDYIDWFRMKVDDLPPREYWATAVEDMGLATALQDAKRRGEQRADQEAKAEQDAKTQQAERDRRTKAAHERLKGR